ncbi:hypothetical protein L596_025403 [Steinernema carpocapsae]|uniref:NF-X1-type domain-containing protein n=1 Tax=Steinernema carpocapsae TaxID=34508 RepID=A0A4U5M8I5_STECR|nr:hypothetical protein L596_025403 [Steinernema carpocapsae]
MHRQQRRPPREAGENGTPAANDQPARERTPNQRGRGGRGGRGGTPRDAGTPHRPAQRFGEWTQKKVFPIGYKDVQEMCEAIDRNELLSGSTDLIRKVTSLPFLQRLNEMWREEDSTTKMLKVIVQAISHSETDLTQLTHHFIDELLKSRLFDSINEHHVQKLIIGPNLRNSTKQLLNNFIQLITMILRRKPNVVEKFVQPVALLKMVSDKCAEHFKDELEENMITLQRVLENELEQKTRMVTTRTPKAMPKEDNSNVAPPQDFREISVVPTKEDMNLVGKPYLRKNVAKGRYNDGEHYLDVQFRLLREDFIDPLRTGVNDYRTAAKNPKNFVYVYKNVKIAFPELDKFSGNMICTVSFDKRSNCRWIRQMIFGSLVVLSKDGFQNDFIFGTVHARDVRDLGAGKVKLFFENLGELDYQAAYQMIESSAYYEAYHHILRGLQSFRPGEKIPFHRYLVEVNTKPGLPAYFNHDYKIDFGVICGQTRRTKFVDVRRAHEQLTPKEIGLDESQHKALTMAFQQELVVIQGPPGTGKTHIGHQISRVLLANQTMWNPNQDKPMLVVCYTNHALDQFLNGILNFMNKDSVDKQIANQQKIIRVGSRCKEENLKQFMLNEVKKKTHFNMANDIWARRKQCYVDRKTVSEKMDATSKSLTSLRDNIVDFYKLAGYMIDGVKVVDVQHVAQITQLVGRGNGNLSANDVFIEWLTRAARPDERRNLGEEITMDLSLIQYLVHRAKLPEQLAKNLSFMYHNNMDDIIAYYDQNATNEEVIQNLINEPLPGVRLWPRLADMETLMANLRILETDAYEALVIHGGNMELAAEMLTNLIEENLIVVQDEEEEQEDEEQKAEPEVREIDLLYEYEQERHVDYEDDFDNLLDLAQGGLGRHNAQAMEILEAIDAEDDDEWSVVGQNEKQNRLKRLKNVTKRILRSQACSEHEAERVADIWALPVQDRWKLYKFWTNTLTEKLQMTLRTQERDYSRLTQMLKEINQLADVELLKSARVLGMTTTGAARLQSVLKTIQCPVVIIEEAAEVLESHIVTSLTVNTKHAILIGDHKQLRPTAAVYNLTKNFDLDVSLFERLINNDFPYAMLQNQHRMRTEIARALMPHFYKDLRDDPSVLRYAPIAGLAKNFLFINHHKKEKQDQDQRSHMNEFEGEYAVRLARYLLYQGHTPEQVTILCTYMEQMLFCRERAFDLLGKDHNLRIEVVDNYQGEESEIIILSLVRSRNPEGKIGFLNVPNRVCVALSRAKRGLYCLGNIDFLADKCQLWKNIKGSLEDSNALSKDLEVVCHNHRTRQVLEHWKDFDKKTSLGGCELPCEIRLDCGHVCLKLCHPTSHENEECNQPCVKSCKNGHPCKKRCHEPCEDCKIKVSATLLCGHPTEKHCFKAVKDVRCRFPCPKKLICGHNCVNNCSQDCTKLCKEKVTKQLPCGHSLKMACSEDPKNFPCNTVVEKLWTGCGHSVKVKCHVNPAASLCPNPCGKNLPDCEHLCSGTCGTCRQGRLHVRCEKVCERVLICGHVCGGKCSTTCPPCEKPCETACAHSRCSNVVNSHYNSQKCRVMLGKANKGRKCGDLCPPCVEPCANRCTHRVGGKPRICAKSCMAPCDIDACNERCGKLMTCGHQCLGLCSEDCPEICNLCPEGKLREAYNDASTVFLGFEDQEDALFIKLTCGHCIESQGMDGWVKSLVEGTSEDTNSAQAIIQITCPKCKSPVMKSCRYQKQLSRRILDIEQIKRKILGGTRRELDQRRAEILAKLTDIIAKGDIKNVKRCNTEVKLWVEPFKTLDHDLRNAKAQWTEVPLTKIENLIGFLARMATLLVQIESKKIMSLAQYQPKKLLYPQLNKAAKLIFGGTTVEIQLRYEWQLMLEIFEKKLMDKACSTLMIQQFETELNRLERLIKLGELFMLANATEDIKEEGYATVERLHKLLNGHVPSDNNSLEADAYLQQGLQNVLRREDGNQEDLRSRGQRLVQVS